MSEAELLQIMCFCPETENLLPRVLHKCKRASFFFFLLNYVC